MSKRRPFSLLNDEQMSNWLGVKHLPINLHLYWFDELPSGRCVSCRAFDPSTTWASHSLLVTRVFEGTNQRGRRVICTRLPRGHLYTSPAASSVHVYFLWQAQYLVTLEWILCGVLVAGTLFSAVAVLLFMAGAIFGEIWMILEFLDIFWRGRRVIWCSWGFDRSSIYNSLFMTLE